MQKSLHKFLILSEVGALLLGISVWVGHEDSF